MDGGSQCELEAQAVSLVHWDLPQHTCLCSVFLHTESNIISKTVAEPLAAEYKGRENSMHAGTIGAFLTKP